MHRKSNEQFQIAGERELTEASALWSKRWKLVVCYNKVFLTFLNERSLNVFKRKYKELGKEDRELDVI